MDIQDNLLSQGKNQTPWRLFTPNDAHKECAVLWLQGWTSSMDSHKEGVARMSTQTGLTFATLDYAGHGLHEVCLEDSTRKQQHEEVMSIYDELTRLGYGKIIAIGGSFGGYMAALLVGKRPVHTVVLRAPAMYKDDEFNIPYKNTERWQNSDVYQQGRTDEDFIHNNAATKAIKAFDGFTYVLEHELDEQVPRIMPRTYFEAAKHGNYILIPKTKHSPKLMPNPRPHFDYIEHFVIAIIEAVKLEEKLHAGISSSE